MEEFTYTDILGKRHQKAIKNFKYSGTDDSILYNKYLSPLAKWIVENYVPEIIAPNLITVIGFMFVIIPHIIIEATTLSGETPLRLLCLIYGCGIFIYNTFDNMDGKQARKINASSSLGMLLDHGCDSMNAVIQAMTMSKILDLDSITTSVCIFIPVALFFLSTYEQYATHFFYLGKINGVNEGMVALVGICFISAMFGPEFWSVPSFLFGLQRNTLVAMSVGSFGVYTILSQHMPNIRAKLNDKRIMKDFFLLLVWSVFFFAQGFLETGFTQRSYLYIYGTQASKIIILVQLAHISSSEAKLNRKVNSVIVGLLGILFFSNLFGTDLPLLRRCALLLAVVDYCIFVSTIARRMAKLLDINIFTLKSKNKPGKSQIGRRNVRGNIRESSTEASAH